MGNEKALLAAQVDFEGSAVRARIEDDCRETREMFEGLSAQEREALAAEAWTIGVQALSTAYHGATEAKEERKPCRLSTLPPTGW